MRYNWELPDWPDFTYSLTGLESVLEAFLLETGEITGILKSLPEHVKQESIIETMLSEAIKTSQIEGEFLSRQDVMSSIRNNIGLSATPEPVHDRKSQGMGQLMVDIRGTYQQALTTNKLWQWHQMVMIDSVRIRAGQWRTGNEPMQILSGSIGKEKIHFQAPPSAQVEAEMDLFVTWFNQTAPQGNKPIKVAPVRAAIVHLYFESIHPFEDGNGRIGRALAEKALSQTAERPLLISLSKTIEADKQRYYAALEKAQKSNEISEWIRYFADVILNAQIESRQLINFTLQKTRFFDRHGSQMNPRQTKVIDKMMQAGKDGFEGGMSAKKYMSITKTSKATATRDLQQLLELGILSTEGGGRSVHYKLLL
ncbi:Fic family protein [Dyadobacter psychrotolerans]|uniref:Fic family protein n=1 Tax=Dyadobacter psychrotolerans TaxID=2541721 RepID=A0A4R5DXC9_9BACT|nr:DUF4172 domain-containing protein [Dyadobacter psychrotolerans]TDE17100.1 Fic family protein [Dyadobacter psychrotolerans]